MERREPTPPREEGPALDLGDLDWTIPPDSQPGSHVATLGWVARRFRNASIQAVVALALTGLALGWWVASGRMPSADPQLGPAALVLHIVAFGAAWLALRGAVETWQALYLGAGQSPPRGNMTQVIILTSGAVMIFNAAMMVSSILG